MTVNTILEQKKVKSVEVAEGGVILRTDRALILTDLIISKVQEGRLVFRIVGDGFKFDLLFVEEKGTFNYHFPEGLKFWKGGMLEVVKLSEGTDLITIGYLEYDAPNQAKWRLNNG